MRVRRVLAAVLIAVALVVGLVTATRSLRAGHAAVARVAAQPRVNGRLALLHGDADRFVDFVRRAVPPSATVVIVQPAGPVPANQAVTGPLGRCGNSANGGQYWLLVYELLPRAAVCSGVGAWTVYLGVPVPAGSSVHRFTATLGVQAP